MICNACGMLLSDGSKFCNNCGASVGASEPKDEAPPSEEKAESALSKEEAERLIQKLAAAGVKIEIKYEAKQDEAASTDRYTVLLNAVGHNRPEVLHIVREVTALPLSNVENLVNVAPAIIREGLSKREAEAIRQRLVGAGAAARVEPTSRGARLPPAVESNFRPPDPAPVAAPTNSMTSGCVAIIVIIFLIFLCVALGQKPSRVY
jgi:large subunit ribosomal protein L7/L12